MILKKITLLLLITLLFGTIACSDDDEIPANTPPAITITSPTDAEMAAGYNRGEQITINGSVSDDKEINNLVIEVFYGISSLYEDEETDIDQQSYDFEQTIQVPSLAPTGEYRVIFTATDSEGLSSSVEKTVLLR